MQYTNMALRGLLLSSLLSPAAHADDPVILVTATRTAQTADESLASVTVIDRAEIERAQAPTLAELLRGRAGIDLTRNGGVGTSTNLYMRGTEAGHVMLLVDGVRLGSATSGQAAWQYIPLDQIERIEIVRGPHAALYGSDAIGGVIQVFTRKGGERPHIYASYGAGSRDRSEMTAGFSGRGHGFDLSLSASHFQSDGIDAQTPPANTETDKDGYTNDALTARLGRDFESGARLELSLFHSDSWSEFDGNPNQAHAVEQSAAVRLDLPVNALWHTQFLLARGDDEGDNFTSAAYRSTFDTYRHQFSWQNDLYLGDDDTLTVGFDYVEDQVRSTTAYAELERDNRGLFAQWQHSAGRLDWLLALRGDDNQTFGNHTTGNLALGYRFDNALRLTASYGSAYKAPTFNQLYWPGAGNAALKPEESETLEFGLGAPLPAQGEWDVNLYFTEADNLISGWPPVNIGKARINGLETRIAATLLGWHTNAEFTYTDHQDTQTNRRLRRRATRSLRLDADRDFGRWSAGASVVAQGLRYDDTANATRLPSYGVLNLHARYDIDNTWSLRASADNVLNKQYETVKGYNQPGAEYFVALHYQPE